MIQPLLQPAALFQLYPCLSQGLRPRDVSEGAYRVRFARDLAELDEVFAVSRCSTWGWGGARLLLHRRAGPGRIRPHLPSPDRRAPREREDCRHLPAVRLFGETPLPESSRAPSERAADPPITSPIRPPGPAVRPPGAAGGISGRAVRPPAPACGIFRSSVRLTGRLGGIFRPACRLPATVCGISGPAVRLPGAACGIFRPAVHLPSPAGGIFRPECLLPGETSGMPRPAMGPPGEKDRLFQPELRPPNGAEGAFLPANRPPGGRDRIVRPAGEGGRASCLPPSLHLLDDAPHHLQGTGAFVLPHPPGDEQRQIRQLQRLPDVLTGGPQARRADPRRQGGAPGSPGGLLDQLPPPGDRIALQRRFRVRRFREEAIPLRFSDVPG
jgi:hypothetical protein